MNKSWVEYVSENWSEVERVVVLVIDELGHGCYDDDYEETVYMDPYGNVFVSACADVDDCLGVWCVVTRTAKFWGYECAIDGVRYFSDVVKEKALEKARCWDRGYGMYGDWAPGVG